MQRTLALPAAVLALVCVVLPAAAQSLQPKSIRFVGAPEYSDAELTSAAELKPGADLTYAEINNRAQKLIDSGVFSAVAFKFDGQELTFQLSPVSGLLPIRLQNLPFPSGKDLENQLHRQLPLYHGLVPERGGLAESVRSALEQMLAAQGIKATVAAMPFRNGALNKTAAVSFSITAPPVLVGELKTEGTIVALDPKASAILAKFPGSVYDAQGTIEQIETGLSTYYKDQGYPEPAIHATAGVKPSVSSNAIRIPLHVSILPGAQFRLAGIQLAPGLLVTQAEVDHQSHVHAGDIADGSSLHEDWNFIERQYHNRGYIKAKVEATPTFDRAAKTVSYLVSVDPGPVYTMGALSIENVTDDLRATMLAAWKVPAGSVFNENSVLSFFATRGVNPALEQVFSGANCKYFMHPNDSTHVVDVTLTLEKKD
ncbi:MAG: POTRA domain-containing protein [Terracidiphilus sp.]